MYMIIYMPLTHHFLFAHVVFNIVKDDLKIPAHRGDLAHKEFPLDPVGFVVIVVIEPVPLNFPRNG